METINESKLNSLINYLNDNLLMSINNGMTMDKKIDVVKRFSYLIDINLMYIGYRETLVKIISHS